MVSISKLIRYEGGEMEFDEMLELFSELVKSGEAWQLQGSYGRVASDLIRDGYLTANGEINEKD